MNEEIYKTTADTLANRILSLIPDHPYILDMGTASDLLNVDAFEYSDLNPSYYQVSWALAKAKEMHNERERATDSNQD
jgi:hypothetical protein